MIKLDLVCRVCGAPNELALQPRNRTRPKDAEYKLYCCNCRAVRPFVDAAVYEPAPPEIPKKPPAERKRKPRVIGLCSYVKHPKDLTWNDIKKERCLEKKCNYFTWLDLSVRDAWRKENGSEKRPLICRQGTPEERKRRRFEKNLRDLISSGAPWQWIDEKSERLLIGDRLEYYAGTTWWIDRKTGETGYAMLKKLLKNYNADL